MEAHPCEKESFLDKIWRYVNEIEGISLGVGDDDLEEYDDEDYELDEDGEPDYDRLKDSKKVVIINGGMF